MLQTLLLSKRRAVDSRVAGFVCHLLQGALPTFEIVHHGACRLSMWSSLLP